MAAFEDIDRLDSVLARMTELSDASRVRQARKNPFQNPDYMGFHRDILEKWLPEGQAHLHLLELGSQVASYIYGFCYAGKYSFFQTGFDPSFSHLSPGHLALGFLVEQMFGTGVTEIDYLRGDHEYKARHSNAVRNTVSFTFFRPGLARHSKRCFDATRQIVRGNGRPTTPPAQ